MKNSNNNFQLQFVKVSPMVKNLVIVNVAIWVVGQLILDKMILPVPWISNYFSLVPKLFVEDFMVWQPLTYMLSLIHI